MLSGGAPEADYTFFVLIGVIALFQDWRPFLLGIVFVLVHHTVLGMMLPYAAFAREGDMPASFDRLLIHSAFLLATSVAGVVAWKANEIEASCDVLTGLPNRRMLQATLDRLNGDVRGPGVGLVALDLCGFTKVNDVYGHLAGDRVLVEVGRRLGAAIASEHRGLLARIGGAEFALFVPWATETEVLELSQRVVRCFDEPVTLGDRSAHLAVSMGVLACAPGAATSAEMLRDVDVAKDSAKRQYGDLGGICVFTPALRDEARRAFELELDLAGCVERDELVLHYQPIVDLVTNRIVGAEALVRWEHPTLGTVGPLAFIRSRSRRATLSPSADGSCARRHGNWRCGMRRFRTGMP